VEATLLTGKRSLVPGIRGSGNVSAPGSIEAREFTLGVTGDNRPHKRFGETRIEGMKSARVHFCSNLTNGQAGSTARIPCK
jgi:hypothetical protein